jgi:polyferredoxin
MKLSLRSWRPRHLLAAWCAYWAALALVTLWPAIAAGWRISQQAHGKGSVSGSFGNDIISATIVDSGKTTWAGSITPVHLALLIAGPPLILWLLWLMRASRTNNAGDPGALNHGTQKELYGSDSRTQIFDSSTSKRGTREES